MQDNCKRPCNAGKLDLTDNVYDYILAHTCRTAAGGPCNTEQLELTDSLYSYILSHTPELKVRPVDGRPSWTVHAHGATCKMQLIVRGPASCS